MKFVEKVRVLRETLKVMKLTFFKSIKLAIYYFAACSVIEKFAELSGAKVTGKKIGWIVVLAIVADRLVDYYKLKLTLDKAMNSKIRIPELILFKRAVKELNLSENAMKKLDEIMKVQIETLKQFEDISLNELYELTVKKGGLTGVFHILAFKGDADARELENAFVVGAFMQLFDDWLDVEQDRKEGVKTLFTEGVLTFDNLKELAKMYTMMLDENYAKMIRWVMSRAKLFKLGKKILGG